MSYHLCFIAADPRDVWVALKAKVFFNFNWLVNAVYSGFFNDLIEDITFALNTVSLDPDVQFLRQLLLSVRRSVVYNPLSLAAILSSQKVEKPEVPAVDSVKVVVDEAVAWMNQVHLQVSVYLQSLVSTF